ncbi:hypothetical protein RJ43_14665 [Alteromonas macleodii]|uniref:type I restriction-modification enzyme R subunit C-terminal domain-containing protein n=1 Tax=Alteromonas macleodii TaxID=28108 RepID=UPI00057F6502|nr:type I restriction-modification enzyme R subunit C-terminal domain-containing protein [Alteromonas macleodii]KHT49971.1 hypothetical protein RJ43_14665 [Alteromonas macleodii]
MKLLDSKIQGVAGGTKPVYINEHEDEFTNITTGYGDGQKPDDYLRVFNNFVNANSNRLHAIQAVVQAPRELIRQNLKELALVLEQNYFREQDLQVARSEVKNEVIAARIIGFISQAAIGEALIPFEQRVDNALEKILASQAGKHHNYNGSIP